MSDHVPVSNHAIVLSAESMKSEDIRATVDSNIAFVNALFGEFLKPTEISRDALLSYYVDYYLAQVNNGGFAQFVYNTGWEPAIIELVKDGLQKIGATRHADLFSRGELLVTAPKNKLNAFFSSAFFGKNAERDRLNGITDQFFSLEKTESLERLNAEWLKSRSGLVVVPAEKIGEQVASRASQITDREARFAQARASEPRYMKSIRSLCDLTGHTLERVTAGDPTNEYEGRRILAWHFITDKGHHFMVEADGKAMMFAGETKQKLAELTVA